MKKGFELRMKYILINSVFIFVLTSCNIIKPDPFKVEYENKLINTCMEARKNNSEKPDYYLCSLEIDEVLYQFRLSNSRNRVSYSAGCNGSESYDACKKNNRKLHWQNLLDRYKESKNKSGKN